MNNRKYDSIDGIMTIMLFLTISMLLIKWEWYIDIPYWIVFAPIYVPIIVALLVIFILSIIDPKQNKND
jgi:membrane protein YdbS with pleckstrin-like domain